MKLIKLFFIGLNLCSLSAFGMHLMLGNQRGERGSLKQLASEHGPSKIKDFVAIMAAFKGITLKHPRAIQSAGVNLPLEEIVYDYLGDAVGHIAIPFSQKEEWGLISDRPIPQKLNALCVVPDGRILGSYRQKNEHGQYPANAIQEFNERTQQWEILYKNEAGPFYDASVKPITRLCVLRNGWYAYSDHLYRTYVKIVDRQTMSSSRGKCEHPLPSCTSDMLQLPDDRLVVGATNGTLSAFTLDKKGKHERKLLAESGVMRASKGAVRLASLPDGFVSCNFHSITRWVAQENESIWPLKSFEFPQARIVSCAASESKIVCVVCVYQPEDDYSDDRGVRDQGRFAVIFFDHELNKISQKPIEVMFSWGCGSVIKFKDGCVGVLAKKYTEYTKAQVQEVDFQKVLGNPPIIDGIDALLSDASHFISTYLVSSESPLYDFAVADSRGKEGIAARLFYRYGQYVRQLCDGHTKSLSN